MSETHDKMIGQLVLGRYRIVQLLAQGGMGAVYLARVEGAAGFAKPVVVKRILPHLSDSVDDQERFIREAQILSNIRHPGIVNVIDFGQAAGAYLMVLEYVHGYHLGQWMKYVIQARGRMSWEVSLLVILQVLAALHYAHTHKRSDGSRATIIHGDISPGNILIDVEGNVRLADFGIARIEAEQTTRKGTIDGIFRGKLSYAAPELLACENATTLSDIYACGVVLHQMLAGANPFNAQDANDIISRMLSLVPPPISSLRSDVPRGLDSVLAKALEKKPSRRPASAMDFAVALRGQLLRTEADITAEMTAVIRSDFMGNLATALGVNPLDELETAWRKFSNYPVTPSMLSMPPTVDLRQFGQKRDIPEESPATTAITQPRDTQPVAGPSNRKLIITVFAAAVVAAGVAVLVALTLRAPAASSEPRYLVVESRDDRIEPQTSPGGAMTAVAARGSTSAVSAPKAAPSIKSPRSESDNRDPLSGLSRTFSKRQPAIQNCFLSNTVNVSGTPEVSIRFSVDAQGKVISAAVRPEAIAATALGQCLQQVAQSTNFGAQDKPLVFSIPITARAR
jgi:eukaryotic-like serine/threonine-protein kinase